MALPGYVCECPIIVSQNQGDFKKKDLIIKLIQDLASKDFLD